MPKTSFTLEQYLNQESRNSNLPIAQQPSFVLTEKLQHNLKALSPMLHLKSKDKEREFENSIIEHIKSPETMKDISQVVGTPQANETEDQFVERSIKNISDYLMKKFK